MVEGMVNTRYEAIAALNLHGPQGKVRDVQAIRDNGHNGFLTLSTALVMELELPFVNTGRAFLPNVEEVEFSVWSE